MYNRTVKCASLFRSHFGIQREGSTSRNMCQTETHIRFEVFDNLQSHLHLRLAPDRIYSDTSTVCFGLYLESWLSAWPFLRMRQLPRRGLAYNLAL